jgi:hypothetical protein
MTATLAVRPQRSHRWIYVLLVIAAIVATITLTFAAFAGSSSGEPARPAGVSTLVAQHDPCTFAGDRRMAC